MFEEHLPRKKTTTQNLHAQTKPTQYLHLTQATVILSVVTNLLFFKAIL